MRVSRVYLPLELTTDATVPITDKTFHYLTRVLRLGANAPLAVFNGEGGEYDATIIEVTKKTALIRTTTFRDDDAESPLRITLAQGLAKGEKMDWIVQKATELGVNEIQPLFTRYSDVKLNDERAEKRRQHWQEIAISACEQCGRNRVPAIHSPISISDWLTSLDQPQPDEKRIVFQPQQSVNTSSASVSSARLLIGPEGGFHDDELKHAGSLGFKFRSMGPRILRSETAAVTAMCLAQTWWGDLNEPNG